MREQCTVDIACYAVPDSTHAIQALTKYGTAMSAIPPPTNANVLETKYGKTSRASPQTRGTTALCLLPYTKKPSPIDPKTRPQSNADVSNALPFVTPNHVAPRR